MNITTKYEIGDIVYAVHPCKVIYGGQIVLNEDISGMESSGINQQYPQADDIYIISPHKVMNITASCKKGFSTEILYELSNGVIRTEKDIFASFEDATEYAVMMYGESSGKSDRSGEYGRTGSLKENVCKKLQQALKSVLSCDQLERFEEEYVKATQGIVFKEA